MYFLQTVRSLWSRTVRGCLQPSLDDSISVMKGLSSSRSHHHVVTCDPSFDSMGHHLDHKPYLISQIDNPHPVDHSYYSQRSPYQPDCVVPYGTFPRRHYSSQHELKDETAVVPYTGGGVPANKGQQRLPVALLDQFDRQLPVPRDGYHTLQYKRAAAALEQRSDSPGRIRHLVHSVQKLFTKSHSLEGPHHGKGSINGGKASPDGEPPAIRHRKRSKSRERCKSAEPKNRTPPSGYWSSDELEREACLFHHGPPGVMTMGRHPDKSQSQYFLEAYSTINDQALKNSRSSNDLGKCSTCTSIPLSVDASQLVKKSSWSSSLTVSRARQVYQKASVNVDKALVKAEACQQERSCQFLQVCKKPFDSPLHPHAHLTHLHLSTTPPLPPPPLERASSFDLSSAEKLVWVLVVSLKEVFVFVGSVSVCVGKRTGVTGVILPLTAFYTLPDVKASRFPSNASSARGSGDQKVCACMYVWVICGAERTGGCLDSDMHLSEEIYDTVSPLTPQVPQDEWGGFPLGKEEDIPCRRMRSGSYVKAMAEDDSGDSDGSPKPSPKMQARRASYLKATQPSLTEMTTLNLTGRTAADMPIKDPCGHIEGCEIRWSDRHASLSGDISQRLHGNTTPLFLPVRSRIHICSSSTKVLRDSTLSTLESPDKDWRICRFEDALGRFGPYRSVRSCCVHLLCMCEAMQMEGGRSTPVLELPLIPILLMRMQGVCLSAKCQRECRACVCWAAWAALKHSPKLQIRSHSYLRAVSEVSINRSLDTLDPKALLASPQYRSRNESYMRAMSTISQVSEVEVNGQIEAVCESVFSEMESQAVDALDLPMPGCFRMRSHSYPAAERCVMWIIRDSVFLYMGCTCQPEADVVWQGCGINSYHLFKLHMLTKLKREQEPDVMPWLG
ncbi:Disks large-associated protein 1 [Labeo rohita]|uniref:Disks large-associated protein 1 n=1 Tax=Labeo rohita TaxID=84645 RepID=A0ABQ8MXP1_LABRO|nr:Disks large-associated protein 1 [Labeo rohita]